jgi:hypothetical protein
VEEDLVSGAEIGRRLGVSRERVRQWASHPKYEFPPSLGRVGGAKVWRWGGVAEWAEARGSRDQASGSKPAKRRAERLHKGEGHDG